MGRTHTVNTKDKLNSLWAIATHYKVSFSEVLKLNTSFKNRKPEWWLNVGDIVNLPDEGKTASSNTTSTQKPGDCKENCPPRFFVVVEITAAVGSTRNHDVRRRGTFGNSVETIHGASLSKFQVASNTELYIGGFYDYEGNDAKYRRAEVPTDLYAIYVHGKSQFIVGEVTKDTFQQIKKVYLWANNMQASFWRNDLHEGIAVGRIIIPRDPSGESSITEHPQTKESLPKKSMKILFKVGILESAAVYIRREMIKNSKSGSIPKTKLDWAVRAHEGRPWDYKQHIRPIWAEFIRMGNYAQAVDSGAFSNFHVGYVAAAGGWKKDEILSISDISQRASTAGADTNEDVFAIGAGHDCFTRNNGPTLEGKRKTKGWFGEEKEESFIMDQVIKMDAAHSDLVQFLEIYQFHYDVLGP